MWQRGKRGFTIVEVLLAAALICGGLLCVVALLPSGVVSLKKAEDLQTAAAYGVEVIEATRSGVAATPGLDDFHVTLNSTDFHVTRNAAQVPGTGGQLVDVVVTLAWPRQKVPLTMSTRMLAP